MCIRDRATAAGLFDIDSGNVIYAKNVHEKLNPASLTKVLTALCALKYGNLDDVLTASENVYVHESGAVKLGLEAGDTMTLDQACLLYTSSCLCSRHQIQPCMTLVLDQCLFEPACSLDYIYKIIDNTILQSHDDIQITKSDIRIDQKDVYKRQP